MYTKQIKKQSKAFKRIKRASADLCIFIIRPTNARMWHKAIFEVGLVSGPKPTRVRQGQKYLRPRRYQAINPPPKGIKAWGDGPVRPEELSSAEAHSAEPSRGKTAYQMRPNDWRGKVTNTLKERPRTSVFICIYHTSHQRTNLSPKSCSYEGKATPLLPRHVNRKVFYKKNMDVENKSFFSLI